MVLGYLAAAVLFVGPAAFGHGFYGPADLGQSSALTHVAGAAGAKNSLLSDPYTTVDPVLRYVTAQVRAGHLPTWNPFNGAGVPLLADEQAAVFSPFTALHYVLPFALANGLAAVLELWLMASFTYAWLRGHVRSELAAAAGGAVMAFAGYQIIWLDWGVMAASGLALPLGLWSVRAAFGARRDGARSREWVATAGLATAVALSVLGGHVETAAFADLTVAAYAVARMVGWSRATSPGDPGRPGGTGRLRLGGRLLVGAAVGVALSGAALLPLARYEGVSQRATILAGRPAAVTVGYPASSAATVAFPNLFGGPQLGSEDTSYYGPVIPNYAEGNANSVGLATLVLAVLGLLGLGRAGGRRRLTAFALALVILDGLAIYTKTAGTVWAHLPLVGRTDLNRSQDVGIIGLAILVSIGVEALTSPRLSRGVRAVAAPAAFVGIAAPLLWDAIVVGRRVQAGSAWGTSVEQEIAAAVAAAALVGALAFFRSRGAAAALGAALLITIVAAEALPLRSFDPTVPKWAAYPTPASLAAVRRVVGTAPVMWLDSTLGQADTNLWYGLADVGTYDGLDLRWHDELYTAALALPLTGTSPARPEVAPPCAERLSLLGVQWVVGEGAAPSGLASGAAVGGVTVTPVAGSSPVALIGTAIAIPDDTVALRRLTSCAFDPSRQLVIDAKPNRVAASYPSGGTAEVGQAVVAARSADTLDVRASATHPSWLLVRQSWAPGWSATLDGRPVPLRRADVAFQAVEVPAGVHTVRLAYQAPGLRPGLLLSALGLLAGVGILGAAVASSRVPAGHARRRRGRARPRRRAPGRVPHQS